MDGVGRIASGTAIESNAWSNCREAMDGNSQAGDKLCKAELPNDEHSHPCALVSGNPCRNDVLLKTCVYDERVAWECDMGRATSDVEILVFRCLQGLTAKRVGTR